MLNSLLENIYHLPGFMYSFANDKFIFGKNLWQEKFSKIQQISQRNISGYSLGANTALIYSLTNLDKNYILINPVLFSRNVFKICFLYLVMVFRERKNVDLKGVVSFKYLPLAMYNSICILRNNQWEFLEKIPKENIKIYFGEHDLFFTEVVRKKLSNLGISFTVVKNAGHAKNINIHEIIINSVKQFKNV